MSENNIYISEFEWLRLSRTLLYDAYWPPFYPSLDYSAEKGIQVARELSANVIRFGSIGKWALYPSKIMPQHPDLKGRDLLGDTIDLAKKSDIKTVVYIPVGHGLPESLVVKQKPEWLYCLDDGKVPAPVRHFGAPGVVPVCMAGQYHEDILSIVKEIVESYDVDGVYLDGPYHGWIFTDTICQCPACRKKFKESSDFDLPSNADLKTKKNDPAFMKIYSVYLDWVTGILVKTAKEIREIVNSKAGRKLPLLFNGCSAEYLKDCHQQEMIAQFDGFLMESHKGGIKGAGRGIHFGKIIWNYTNKHSGWPRLSSPELEEESALSARLALAQGSAPIVSYSGRFFGEKRYEKALKDVFDFMRDNEADFAGISSMKFAAVLSASGMMPDETVNEAARRRDEALYGAAALFKDNSIQHLILPPDALKEASGLSNYKIIYMPSVSELSVSEAETLRAYVSEGGTLILSGSNIFKGSGRPIIEEISGVREKKKDVALDTLMEFHRWDQTDEPWDIYMSRSKTYENQAAEIPDSETFLPIGDYIPLEAMDDVSVPAYFVKGSDREAFLPAITINKYGKGHVISIAYQLEKIYGRSFSSGLRNFIKGILEQISPLPYALSVHARVFTNMTSRNGASFLHIVDEDSEREKLTCDITISIGNFKNLKIASLTEKREIPYEKENGKAILKNYTVKKYECLKLTETE